MGDEPTSNDDRAGGSAPGGATAEVTVVGGGVVGLACAYYLAKRGGRVTLLERDHVGAGASAGNAGTVSAGHPPLNRPGRIRQALTQMTDPTSPLYVRPRWDPGLWRWLLGFARYCTEAHVEHAMRVMAPLGKDTLALFDQLIREERIECGYRADGYFDACATEAGLQAARSEAAIIQRYGYGPELVDGDELRRREPAFGPGLLGGVYYPEAATLDPARFVQRLARTCEGLGVDIREGVGVQAVDVRSGRVAGVVTHGGEVIGSDAVVLATGPYSMDLSRRFGVRIPVQPGKGYHRDVDIGPNGAPRMRHACVLHESSVFCTPMDTVVRFAGTMEFSGINRTLRPERLRQLTRAARDAFPGLGTARPISEWCGLRPMAMDGLPIVGGISGVDGLAVATGHGMLGLTLAPVTGELIANLVLDGGDPRLGPLSPDRFG